MQNRECSLAVTTRSGPLAHSTFVHSLISVACAFPVPGRAGRRFKIPDTDREHKRLASAPPEITIARNRLARIETQISS